MGQTMYVAVEYRGHFRLFTLTKTVRGLNVLFHLLKTSQVDFSIWCLSNKLVYSLAKQLVSSTWPACGFSVRSSTSS